MDCRESVAGVIWPEESERVTYYIHKWGSLGPRHTETRPFYVTESGKLTHPTTVTCRGRHSLQEALPVCSSLRQDGIMLHTTTWEEAVSSAIDLNDYARQVRELADEKGFGSGSDRIWEMLALIHTEVSEATDAYKKGESMEDVGEELIDALIRIFHLLSALDLDSERLYQKKMAKNWARPYKYNTVRGG